MEQLIDNFIKEKINNYNSEFVPQIKNAIYCLELTNKTFNSIIDENSTILSDRLEWPIIFEMYKRNYEYCSGTLVLFLGMQTPSCEALCRTAIEGSVNLTYISIGDTISKQIAYIKNHISEERKQNTNWKDEVKRSKHSQDEKNYHYNAITQKNSALSHYESMFSNSLNQSGVNYHNCEMKWPNIYERFKQIDRSVEYRTLYMALCSQSHNDAEDIMNSMLAQITPDVIGMRDAQKIEQYWFSLFYVLSALKYHIYATMMAVGKFEIKTNKFIDIYKVVENDLLWIAENMGNIVQSIIHEQN